MVNAELTKAYCDWKGWTGEAFGHLSIEQAAYFKAEVRKARRNFPRGSRVLEIGFGNGSFLTYARKQGWDVCGTEINPYLIDAARTAGFEVFGAATLEEMRGRKFDLVAAFDVLEHIHRDALLSFVASVKEILLPGGVFLARFPNGDSPFGLPYQNGDITHVTAIGTGIVEYIASSLGLEVVFVGAIANPVWGIGLGRLIKRSVLNAIWRVTNIFVRYVFHGGMKMAFVSPNLIMLLAVPAK
jgi:SAM-dependent methyltransferase